ncbi:MAG: PEP-CTERM sorting domain-containing protein [Phenylobacterium sp.]|nr:MAG: PEP-CTERM sorting domain-containing protein [Phenylobacterium sp.]
MDNVSLTDMTTPGGELVTNGDFEAGPLNAVPSGWSYLNNTFGAGFGGHVQGYCGIDPGTGPSNCYVDGGVQDYDVMWQAIATTTNDVYQLSFFLMDTGGAGVFSALSTNGDVTDQFGNGRNLVVYGGVLPVSDTGVPEPAAWAMMLLGFGGIGAMVRGRRRQAAVA